MAYGLPTRGQSDWDDELNNSMEALRADVQTAKSDATSARSDAAYAKQQVDAAGSLANSRDAAAASAASASASATSAATSASTAATKALEANTSANNAAASAAAADASTLTWKGAWSAGTAYVTNDAVLYGGSTYRRKVAGTTATAPDSDTTNWGLVASKGTDGITSVNSKTGPTVTLTQDDVGDGTTYKRYSATDKAKLAGLAAVATSGSASDITLGTLPNSVLPPLAISETFPVASQAAMLALTAQQGDVAIRSDLNKSFILATNSPSTLADWKELLTPTDAVTSVAGKVGVVSLVKADVGLSNVDNTADTAKPVSTAQQAMLDLKTEAHTFSVTGAVAVATGKSRIYVEGNYTIVSIRASANTAPTGASLICDVNKNGTTIYTTQANRPTIAASSFTSSMNTPDVTTLAAGDYLTVDVDQVGSTVAGSDLTVTIRLRRTS